MPEQNPLNFCRSCGQDFNGLTLFDAHRVGKHAYTLAEGAAMTPPRFDGRRCLTALEMAAKGWNLNQRGRWVNANEKMPVERLR